jgi:hypothetical protein
LTESHSLIVVVASVASSAYTTLVVGFAVGVLSLAIHNAVRPTNDVPRITGSASASAEVCIAERVHWDAEIVLAEVVTTRTCRTD